MQTDDTIVALSTPAGVGAIAVIRLSGKNAIEIADANFKSISKKKLETQPSHTIHLGHLVDGTRIIDEVLVSIFKAPNSYTGENVIEVSCHGSSYIQQQIVQLFLRTGCRMATAGEFTLRAFLNGKMDLSQAEAVADLIAVENGAAHQLAVQQMRGGFSSEIADLREKLLKFSALIELELDFSEEDVAFVDRSEFKTLVADITSVLKRLIDSFSTGNVIKNGVPVTIVGQPNAGKSTLLNTLLNDERAIVSEIAGTTRDTIEDELVIGGVGFRFIDTAGIRETEDAVEQIGIQRTFDKIAQSQVVMYLFDATRYRSDAAAYRHDIEVINHQYPETSLLVVANKLDVLAESEVTFLRTQFETIYELSAKTGLGVNRLKNRLLEMVNREAISNSDTIVTNTRHYGALLKSLEAIGLVSQGLETALSSDLLSIDIRMAIYHLGEITGEVTSDDILGSIFSDFCIGK